ncbi:MAG TPA: MGMT family protein [Candidatus Levybacteria bacterium]|nr:MGMT family protein [Candidatus Levybacteria bacterium]
MYSVPEIVKQKVYEQVKRVPKGKVTTYGHIAKVLEINPRVVGNALHLNESDDIPCHRVVNVVGRIAPSFGLGGPAEQKKRLEDEGVTFKNEKHVDLKAHLFALQ